jgi:tRNA pseudouridine38-40 synthase
LTQRYFIELQYDGSSFAGWQIQPNARTVQAEIENALSTILRETTAVTGCGRTDTGVHARFFVAHFDSLKSMQKTDLEKLTFKLNRFLPISIHIFKIYPVKPDAHARFDAISRTYKYYLTTSKNPFLEKYAWYYFCDFDFKLMNNTAKILYEYQDFTSFSKLHTQTKTNNCKITFAEWTYENGTWVFTITADRFLRNMVRAIVGTLINVGRGHISTDEFRKIIELKERQKAGQSVPAHGLFLEKVEYPFEK